MWCVMAAMADRVKAELGAVVTIAVLASLSLVRMLARTWTRQHRRRGRP